MTCPLLLPNTEQVRKYCLTILPYETGIEVEAIFMVSVEGYFSDTVMFGRSGVIAKNKDLLKGIEVGLQPGNESTYRISAGLEGLQQLYRLSIFMRGNIIINKQGGYHFHIDCRDVWKNDNRVSDFGEYVYNDYMVRKDNCIILSYLERVKFGKGKGFNEWSVGLGKSNAVRIVRAYKTLEFRTCSQTQSYPILMKRISQCQKIVKVIKNKFLNS